MKLFFWLLSVLFSLFGGISFANAAQEWKGSSTYIKINWDGSGEIQVGGDRVLIEQHSWVMNDFEFLAVGKIAPESCYIRIDGAVSNAGNLAFEYNGKNYYAVKVGSLP